MIRHIVLIKTQETKEVEKLLDGLLKLKSRVSGLLNLEIKKDLSGRAKGFERLFLMDFKDEDALKEWAIHPEHGPIRDDLLRLSEMIVFDYHV